MGRNFVNFNLSGYLKFLMKNCKNIMGKLDEFMEKIRLIFVNENWKISKKKLGKSGRKFKQILRKNNKNLKKFFGNCENETKYRRKFYKKFLALVDLTKYLLYYRLRNITSSQLTKTTTFDVSFKFSYKS